MQFWCWKKRPGASGTSASSRFRSAFIRTGGGPRRHYESAGLTGALRPGDSLPEIARAESRHRQRSDAPERGRLSGSSGPGCRIGRGHHDRPDDYAKDGWRPFHYCHAYPAAVLKQVFTDESVVGNVEKFCAPPVAAGEKELNGYSAARDIPPATSRLTEMFIPVCSFPCHVAICAGSGSWTSGGTRKPSKKSARFTFGTSRPARDALTSEPVPGVPGWPGRKAICAAPPRQIARSPIPGREFHPPT